MRSTLSIDIEAPARLVFDLARDVQRWPALLPHYRDVRVEEREAQPGGAVTARMLAIRPVVPLLGSIIAERYTFFTRAAAPRMPGGVHA